MNTTTATRYTPDEAMLTQDQVSVPDPEHQRALLYPGFAVRLPDTQKVAGYLWHDGNLWCWKTPNASAYGRQEIKRFAIAALLDAVQQ